MFSQPHHSTRLVDMLTRFYRSMTNCHHSKRLQSVEARTGHMIKCCDRHWLPFNGFEVSVAWCGTAGPGFGTAESGSNSALESDCRLETRQVSTKITIIPALYLVLSHLLQELHRTTQAFNLTDQNVSRTPPKRPPHVRAHGPQLHRYRWCPRHWLRLHTRHLRDGR